MPLKSILTNHEVRNVIDSLLVGIPAATLIFHSETATQPPYMYIGLASLAIGGIDAIYRAIKIK